MKSLKFYRIRYLEAMCSDKTSLKYTVSGARSHFITVGYCVLANLLGNGEMNISEINDVFEEDCLPDLLWLGVHFCCEYQDTSCLGQNNRNSGTLAHNSFGIKPHCKPELSSFSGLTLIKRLEGFLRH